MLQRPRMDGFFQGSLAMVSSLGRRRKMEDRLVAIMFIRLGSVIVFLAIRSHVGSELAILR